MLYTEALSLIIFRLACDIKQMCKYKYKIINTFFGHISPVATVTFNLIVNF